MRKIYCDCCKREIKNVEPMFKMEIFKGHIETGRASEIILNDMCVDCYEKIKHIIDNAELWRTLGH